MDNMLERLKGGLIVSCYAGADFNAEMAVPETMVCVAKSCIAGGAKAIRTNCENVAAVKAAVDVPVIGLKKIYRSGDMISGDFRITPTLKEVEELIKAGADGVAVDGTVRERYDGKTLEQFIGAVKKEFGAFVIADIFPPWRRAWRPGAAALIWWALPFRGTRPIPKTRCPSAPCPAQSRITRLSASCAPQVCLISWPQGALQMGKRCAGRWTPARTAW